MLENNCNTYSVNILRNQNFSQPAGNPADAGQGRVIHISDPYNIVVENKTNATCGLRNSYTVLSCKDL